MRAHVGGLVARIRRARVVVGTVRVVVVLSDAYAQLTYFIEGAVEAVLTREPFVRWDVFALLGGGVEGVERAWIAVLAVHVRVREAHERRVVAAVLTELGFGPDAIAVSVGHTALGPRHLAGVRALCLNVGLARLVRVARRAVPPLVADTKARVRAVVDGAAVAVLALAVELARGRRVDAGLSRILGCREAVERVRVAVVTDEALELAPPELVGGLREPHTSPGLVMVGESNTDSTVRVAPARVGRLVDDQLGRGDGYLCAGRHGQAHGRESDQKIAKHCVFLPSLRSGILRVIVGGFCGVSRSRGLCRPSFLITKRIANKKEGDMFVKSNARV